MCEERLQLHMSMHVMLQVKTLQIFILGTLEDFSVDQCN